MQGPFESPREDKSNIYQNWSIKLLAFPLLLAIALVAFILSHPDFVRLIANGVQA